MRVGLIHRYKVSSNDMDVGYVRSIDGLGNEATVYEVPFPDGSVESHVTAVRAARISLTDAKIENPAWAEWMMKLLRNGTEDNRRDFIIEDLETGTEWSVLGAIVTSFGTSYNKDSDGIPMINVSLSARIVERGVDYAEQVEPIYAYLGDDIKLQMPGMASYKHNAEYGDATVPGIDGDNSEWIKGSGAEIKLPFHIVGSGTITAKDYYERLVALVRKSKSGPSPQVFAFKYGDSFYPKVKVVDLEWEDVALDKSGNMLIAKGALTMKELWVDVEHTQAEDKGLGVYETTGFECLHFIANKLWGRESLWIALLSYNPLLNLDGPMLNPGTSISVPPYDFVSRFNIGASSVNEAGTI